jgi:hypothetical protein
LVEIQDSSFQLGKHVGEIKAWCEAAKNEAKNMSFSAPFTPDYYDLLLPFMEGLAQSNDVEFFLEKDVLVTDLFPGMDLSGIWIFIIFKKRKMIQDYLSLKEEKSTLVETDSYLGEARRMVAVKLGRLLGYSESSIKERLVD